MKVSLVIPTCNAGSQLKRLLELLKRQTLIPDEILVVDSESTDDTAALAEKEGVKVIQIKRSSFDHGGTRDMAFRACTGDIVLFMTQDALPVNADYIERLVAPFEDCRIAATSGRQIAYPEARPYEKAVRTFRYPAESREWDATAIQACGMRAFHISDVCSAYRRTAYEAVGGFEHPLITNEDMLMAASLLDAGYRLAYCGDAAVYHSHCYTLKQEYRRNRRIGRFLQRYEDRLHCTGEIGEGMKLVKYVLAQLIREGHPKECVSFCFNCAARLLGERAGKRAEAMERRNGSET